ncbi:hypothetical protein RI367_006370 [Sorochytrium milnesiophthora]
MPWSVCLDPPKRALERCFSNSQQLYSLVQEDIKTLVQGAFTSHTAWQLLNLSWETLVTMQVCASY